MAADQMLAAPGIPILQRRPLAASPVLSDYWAITKPDVNVLIAITTGVGFVLGSPATLSEFPWIALLNTLLGTVLVAGGAAALNQWIEHPFDARMRRTARRPVASGRIDPRRALLFGTVLSLAGTAYLVLAAGTLASLLAAGTLLGYLFLYTPSKRVTPLCTLIGAIPGAIPPLIGWAAARGGLDSEAWFLFGMVFLWQFPHFMAIAWMYRDDYRRAGYLVLPDGPATVPFVILQTLLPLVALLPVSLGPVLGGDPSMPYSIGAVVLGLGLCYYGAQFARHRSGSAARQLLTASIVYLPSVLLLMILLRD